MSLLPKSELVNYGEQEAVLNVFFMGMSFPRTRFDVPDPPNSLTAFQCHAGNMKNAVGNPGDQTP